MKLNELVFRPLNHYTPYTEDEVYLLNCFTEIDNLQHAIYFYDSVDHDSNFYNEIKQMVINLIINLYNETIEELKDIAKANFNVCELLEIDFDDNHLILTGYTQSFNPFRVTKDVDSFDIRIHIEYLG